ncbi:MAG TPA: chemotaxis protein CheC [Gammaproteobacteria bacterium]|nr:chemotaxis protein CheC [Gammaproteobacteria bacterium]
MTDNLQLSELEQDLLTELFNLGVGNAAASLSTMVKQEIKLSVPQVEFLSVQKLAEKLGSENSICSVSQIVSGPFTAQSMLLFPEENSLVIVRKLMGEDLPDDTIEELQKEAFSEIGNIVLNACIGSFSNAVNKEFKLDLPVFELAKPDKLFNTPDNNNGTALFIRIHLTLSESKITGYMAFLMGTLSLEQLKAMLTRMLESI